MIKYLQTRVYEISRFHYNNYNYIQTRYYTITNSIMSDPNSLLGSLIIIINIKRNYSCDHLNITFYQLFPPMCRYQRVMLICLVVKNVSFIHLV